MNIINNLVNLNIGEVKEASMKNYTTYKVGGSVLAFVIPKNTKCLIKLLNYLKEKNIKYKIIGNGSNLIFSDLGYEGVIIKLNKFDSFIQNKDKFTVGAGYSLIKFSMEVSKKGYSGMEFATGIPGTIGGSVFMNAGAYNSSMKDVIVSIKVLTPDKKVIELSNKDLKFAYRSSFLKENSGYICLEATFKLNIGNKEEILNLIDDRRKRRLSSQPLEYPSAGSVFRNPDGYYAGALIEDLGYKGKHVGGAYVSNKHANFIINKNNATSEDIIKLIKNIKKDVKDKYNIDLILETEIVK